MANGVEVAHAYVSLIPKLSNNFANIAKQATGSFGNQFKSGISAIGVAAGNILSNAIQSSIGNVGQLLKEGVTYGDALLRYPLVLKSLGVSADEAQISIQKLHEGLRGTPVLVSEGTTAVQRLVATTGDVQKSTDWFTAFNHAIMAGGAPLMVQQAALEQWQQAVSKGQPDRIEFKSFMQSMPGVMKQIGIAMGMTTAQMRDAFAEGEISMEQFNDVLLQLDKNGIEGFANLEEQAKQAMVGIDTGFGLIKKGIIEGFGEMTQRLNISTQMGVFQQIGDNLNAALKGVMTPSVDVFAEVLQSLIQNLGNAENNIVQNSALVGEKIAGGLRIAVNAVRELWHAFTGGGGENLAILFKPSIDVLKNLAQAIIPVITGIGNFIRDNRQLFETLGPIVAKFLEFKLATVGIGMAFKATRGLVGSFLTPFSAVGGVLKTAGAGIGDFMANISEMGALRGTIMSLAPGIVGTFQNLGLGASKAFGMGFSLEEQGIDEKIKELTGLPRLEAEFGKVFGSIASKVQYASLSIAEGFLGGFLTIGSKLAPVISGIGSTIGKVFSSIGTSLMGFFASPAGIIIGIIALIAGALFALYQTNEEFRNSVNEAFGQIAAAFAPVMESFKQAGEQLLPVFTELGTTLANLASTVITSLMPVVKVLIEAFMQIVIAVVPAIMPVINALIPIIMQIAGIINQVVPPVANIISLLVSALVPVIQFIATAIANLIQVLQPVIDFILNVVVTGITVLIGIINTVLKLITGDFEGAAESFKGVLDTIWGFWSEIWNNISSFFTEIWNNIVKGVTEGFNNVVDFFKSIPEKIMGFFDNSPTWLLDAGKNIINGFLDGLKRAWKGVTDFIGGIGSWIAEHKGPRQYDLKLLVPNGQWIMQGLAKGLMLGFGEVQHIINAANTQLQPALQTPSTIPASTYSSIGGVGAPTNVYNFYFDNARLNDDPEIQQAANEFFKQVRRKEAMNNV